MKKYHLNLNQEGQGLTEYVTLLLLISVFSIVAAKSLGSTIKKKIQEADRQINSGISLQN